MNDKEFPPRIKLGAIWRQTTKKGLEFFSGSINDSTSIQIWPNNKRPDKKDPDYIVYLSEKPKKEKEPVVIPEFPMNEDISF